MVQKARSSNAMSLEESNALATISAAISSSSDLRDILETFAHEIRHVIPWDRIVITVLGEETHMAIDKLVSGVVLDEMPTGIEHDFKSSIAYAVIESGKSLLLQGIPQSELEDSYPSLQFGLIRGLRSTLAVPLVFKDVPVGALVLRSKVSNAYSPRHVYLANQICTPIAGAISNTIAETKLSEFSEEQELLADVSRAVNTSLHLGFAAETFASRIRQSIPLDHLVLTDIDRESNTATSMICYGLDIPGRCKRQSFSLEHSIMGNLSNSQETPVVQGLTKDELIEKYPKIEPGAAKGLRSFVFVPILSSEHVIAVLGLCSLHAEAYTPRDVYLIERIATQI